MLWLRHHQLDVWPFVVYYPACLWWVQSLILAGIWIICLSWSFIYFSSLTLGKCTWHTVFTQKISTGHSVSMSELLKLFFYVSDGGWCSTQDGGIQFHLPLWRKNGMEGQIQLPLLIAFPIQKFPQPLFLPEGRVNPLPPAEVLRLNLPFQIILSCNWGRQDTYNYVLHLVWGCLVMPWSCPSWFFSAELF